MTYSLITKKDIMEIIDRLDRDIAFIEKELPQCYVESKEATWHKLHEEHLIMKERALLWMILNNLRDQEALDELNHEILARRD